MNIVKFKFQDGRNCDFLISAYKSGLPEPHSKRLLINAFHGNDDKHVNPLDWNVLSDEHIFMTHIQKAGNCFQAHPDLCRELNAAMPQIASSKLRFKL